MGGPGRDRRRPFGGEGWRSLAQAWLILGTCALATAQPAPSGSLSGKLTDIYSAPLPGATVVLRNVETGAQSQTTTSRNGSYRLTGLPPGEYRLEATTPALTHGALDGIVVTAGHEARMQAAIALEHTPPGVQPPSTIQASNTPPATVQAAAVQAGKLTPILAESVPVPAPPVAAMILQPVASPTPATQALLPTRSAPVSSFSSAPPPSALPHLSFLGIADPPSPEPAHLEAAVSLAELPPSLLKTAALPPDPSIAAIVLALPAASAQHRGAALALAAGAAAQSLAAANSFQSALLGKLIQQDAEDASASTITGDEFQALPLPSRNWSDFLDPSPQTQPRSDGEPDSGESLPAPSIALSNSTLNDPTTDAAPARLAFDPQQSRHGASSSATPIPPEAAIAEARQIASPDPAITVRTRQGSKGLHGQAFAFDRQNIWGARNPFTQWLQESSPATNTTVPVFTAQPYSPGDQQLRWGLGIGGNLRRNRMFWFAAFDGEQRNDPGIATVKHPENFFAQPTNDEMQVLSARLALSSANPVAEGVAAYSGLVESLAGLLGPAPRTSQQWTGFARLDGHVAERHRFSLEGTSALSDAPGGGLTRASETYGNHSFGASHGSETWLLARWESFLTPNLLLVTQGSAGRDVFTSPAETPSAFESTLNASTWGQLPQMVVDSRYGFTIGSPARFGAGTHPDERLFAVQQMANWVHGPLLLKGGFELHHDKDTTTFLRNRAGTYHYAHLTNFVSDALAFAKFGLANLQNPLTTAHSCDQRGKAWRDSTGELHGLGYLPCYSWYTQTLGPPEWYLATNDWAGYGTLQWQPARHFVLSAALRWDRQQQPPPIALVHNPELPLTQSVPSLGDEWGPRLSLAWGARDTHLPVLRMAYGMYFGRTPNAVLETALTQTGSPAGDLNFFLRPTDNLTPGSGGAPSFPYVLAGQPAAFEKPGAVEIAPRLRNPEVHQALAGIEQTLPAHITLRATALVSLARHLPITLDTNIDPATNPGTITYGVVDASGKGPLKAPRITVPFYASWPSSTGPAGRLNSDYQQITQIQSRANSTYEAAMLQLSRNGRRGFSFHARYTYGHAMDWNPNESAQVSGSSVLDPADFQQEYGTSSLDVRHAAAGYLIWDSPWKVKGTAGRLANGWTTSVLGHYNSGLPYSMRTAGALPAFFEANGDAIVGLGPGMNGYGGDQRVYGVGRNTYRYPRTWKADMRLGKRLNLGHARELELMAQSFNLFNHQNVTQLETTGYSIESGSVAGGLPTLNFLTGLKTGQTEFGQPLDINATDFYRPRQIDLGLRLRF